MMLVIFLDDFRHEPIPATLLNAGANNVDLINSLWNQLNVKTLPQNPKRISTLVLKDKLCSVPITMGIPD